MKKFLIILGLIVSVFLVILGGALIFKPSMVLFGDNKIVYENVSDAATYFKDPASIHVLSGTVIDNTIEKEIIPELGELIYVKVTATNGFGGRTTGYYSIMRLKEDDEDVIIFDLEEEENIDYDEIKLCESEENLNVKIINYALKKNFS